LRRVFRSLGGAAPVAVPVALAVLAASAAYAVVEPLYVVEGAVEGVVGLQGATLTYLGREFTPGPLAAALVAYALGLAGTLAAAVAAAGSALAGSRLAPPAYLGVFSYSVVLSAYKAAGFSLKFIEGRYLFRVGLGVVDLGVAEAVAGPAGEVLSVAARLWPLLALLILVLGEAGDARREEEVAAAARGDRGA